MLRRLKPILVGSLLVVYSGMMLAGQCLHEFLGCDHDRMPVCCAAHSAEHGDGSTSLAAQDEHQHSAADCPICRLHTQGQLSTAAVASELRLVVCSEALLHSAARHCLRRPGHSQSARTSRRLTICRHLPFASSDFR